MHGIAYAVDFKHDPITWRNDLSAGLIGEIHAEARVRPLHRFDAYELDGVRIHTQCFGCDFYSGGHDSLLTGCAGFRSHRGGVGVAGGAVGSGMAVSTSGSAMSTGAGVNVSIAGDSDWGSTGAQDQQKHQRYRYDAG